VFAFRSPLLRLSPSGLKPKVISGLRLDSFQLSSGGHLSTMTVAWSFDHWTSRCRQVKAIWVIRIRMMLINVARSSLQRLEGFFCGFFIVRFPPPFSYSFEPARTFSAEQPVSIVRPVCGSGPGCDKSMTINTAMPHMSGPMARFQKP
jgi:hypothetical protein